MDDFFHNLTLSSKLAPDWLHRLKQVQEKYAEIKKFQIHLGDQNPLKHTLVFTVTGDMVMIVTLTLSVTGEVKRKNIDNSQYC